MTRVCSPKAETVSDRKFAVGALHRHAHKAALDERVVLQSRMSQLARFDVRGGAIICPQSLLNRKRVMHVQNDANDPLRTRPDRTPAAQQFRASASLRYPCAFLSKIQEAAGSLPRFRTIQVCPKDLLAVVRKVEHGANRASSPAGWIPR